MNHSHEPATVPARKAKLLVHHRCVKCGSALLLEGWQIDSWCEPIRPTYMPFPHVLQRDCLCGGHANMSVALMPFASFARGG